MKETDPDEFSRHLASASLDADDPTGWFERLYAAAEAGETDIPWNRGEPHPLLVDWASQRAPDGKGRRALVVGCGMGFDAEYVASLGYATVAFDVSATAVASARRRTPDSEVTYTVADLLDLPPAWHEAFDLVVEIMTVQALPPPLHPAATASVTATVAPGGTLLVIAAPADETTPTTEGPPWPLTRPEIDAFTNPDLAPTHVEQLPFPAPPTHRWRAEFHRHPS